MGEPLILALDQGTTSTRAILFDRSGGALAVASRPLAQSYPRDGWVEHDPEAIFEASVAVLREAPARAGRNLADVAAIGIANQRETTVVWERASGRPVHPAIVWQDRRTGSVCEDLRRAGAEAEVVARSGLLLDAYFSATKIAWILDHVEGARSAAERGELLGGTVDAWLVWRLTGGAVHATDATNASRTLLMDLERQAWSPELCALFGVPQVMLPQIRDTAGDYGQTLPELLGASIAIRGLAGDQQASLMGQGCIAAGEVKATYGTGCFMLMHTGEAAPRSRARLLTTVAARLNGRATYALEGSIFIAGAAIQWICEQLGVADGPSAVEALARRARADHPVILVPAFTGLGAPHWDPSARGALFGLTRDAGLPEIADAAFEACALQTRDLIEAMRADGTEALAAGSGSRPGATDAEVGAEPKILKIDGGMAQSSWFAGKLADVTGAPVACAAYSETTALGAGLFAGLGAGLFDSIEDAARVAGSTPAQRPRTSPEWRNGKYARWRDAVGRTLVERA